VADTKVWEQSAAYLMDTHDKVEAFVKNAGLGFAIPYLHNGQPHDYIPDFIIRIKGDSPVHFIFETKVSFDEIVISFFLTRSAWMTLPVFIYGMMRWPATRAAQRRSTVPGCAGMW